MKENIGINQRAKEYPMIVINGLKIAEHRYIWENHFGKIPVGHSIHHKNGNKKDNRIENLVCVNDKEHMRLHKKKHGQQTQT